MLLFRLILCLFLFGGSSGLADGIVVRSGVRKKPDLARVLNAPPMDCNIVLRQQVGYERQTPEIIAEMKLQVGRLQNGTRLSNQASFPTRESVLEAWSVLKKINDGKFVRADLRLDADGKVAKVLDAKFPSLKRSGKGLIAATRRFFPSVEEGAGLVGVEFAQGPRAPREIPIPGSERFVTEPLSKAAVDENRALAEKIVKGTPEFQFQFYSTEKKAEHDGLVWAMHFSRYRAQEARRQGKPEAEWRVFEQDAALMLEALMLVHRKLPSFLLRKVSQYVKAKRGGVEGDDKNDAFFLSVAEESMKGSILRLDPNQARLSRYAVARFLGHYSRAMQKLDKLVNLVENEGETDPMSRVAQTSRETEDDAGGINARMLLTVALQRLESRETGGMQLRYQRNAELLRHWYGVGREEVDFAEPQSLSQIGAIMGLSRERVRQIMPGAESDLGFVIGEMKAEFEAMNQRERSDRDGADPELDEL